MGLSKSPSHLLPSQCEQESLPAGPEVLLRDFTMEKQHWMEQHGLGAVTEGQPLEVLHETFREKKDLEGRE